MRAERRDLRRDLSPTQSAARTTLTSSTSARHSPTGSRLASPIGLALRAPQVRGRGSCRVGGGRRRGHEVEDALAAVALDDAAVHADLDEDLRPQAHLALAAPLVFGDGDGDALATARDRLVGGDHRRRQLGHQRRALLQGPVERRACLDQLHVELGAFPDDFLFRGLERGLGRLEPRRQFIGLEHLLEHLVFQPLHLALRRLDLVLHGGIFAVGLHFHQLVFVAGEAGVEGGEVFLERAPVGLVRGLFFLSRGDRASGTLQLLVERLLRLGNRCLRLARVRRLRVQGLQADQAFEIWVHLGNCTTLSRAGCRRARCSVRCRVLACRVPRAVCRVQGANGGRLPRKIPVGCIHDTSWLPDFARLGIAPGDTVDGARLGARRRRGRWRPGSDSPRAQGCSDDRRHADDVRELSCALRRGRPRKSEPGAGTRADGEASGLRSAHRAIRSATTGRSSSSFARIRVRGERVTWRASSSGAGTPPHLHFEAAVELRLRPRLGARSVRRSSTARSCCSAAITTR